MRSLLVKQEFRPAARHDAIPIRAHTLLCLQGFRGEGYSASFVDNMALIHQRLEKDPTLFVTILDTPDAVCNACPHVRPNGCSLHGEDTEHHVRAQDHDVLARLGLGEGQQLRWADILERIRISVSADDLTTICNSCPWLPLGYCRDGINGLGTAIHSGTSLPPVEPKSSDEPAEGQ